VRKSVVFITFIVLGVILGAPYLVGRVAQARHAGVLESLSSNIAGAQVLTEDYDAGWLTSIARHRIVFDDRPVGAVTRDLSPAGDPGTTVLIETRIAHGPWPALNGAPGLARMRSTVRFESANGKGFDLPAEVLTMIRFDGGGSSLFTSLPVDEAVAEWPGFVRWDGGSVSVDFDRRGEKIHYVGDLGAFQIASGDAEIALGVLRIGGDANLTRFGFREGDSEFSLESVRFEQPGFSGFSARDITFVTRIDAVDRLADQTVSVDIGKFESERLTDATLSLKANTKRLDAAALGRLVSYGQSGNPVSSTDPMQDLLIAGPELRVDVFSLQSAQGDVFADLDLTIPPVTADQAGAPADLLQTASGEAKVSISPGILSVMTGDPGQGADLAASLVTMGYLRPQDGNYVADVRFKGGLVTINGLPMVIPMGR
jgi:uncharacterized protein YdgA (DUF945 family)